MSKRSRISWTDNQNKQLANAVRNFNAKIRRLEKKYPDKVGSLPEKMSIKSLREIIGTRQDLQREVNALKRFTRRGSEEFVKAPAEYGNEKLRLTKWELDEMLRRTTRVNKARAIKKAEIEEIEMTSRGQPLGYTRGEVGMGKLDKNQLEPIIPFSRVMNNKERKMKFRTLQRESQLGYWDERDKILKEAYIKGLKENYNPEDIKDVIEKIQNMPTKEFREIFEREGGTKVFEWVYPKRRSKSRVKGKGKRYEMDSQDKEYQGYVDAVKNTWGVKTT